ncbi:hypothetical protein GCM10023317_07820 [Actinopolymorpha pittospori]
MLGVYWFLGGGGYPFGADLDPSGKAISLLDSVPPRVVAGAIAVVGLAGAVIAVVMARRRLAGPRAAALIGFAGTLGVVLTAVIPDFRPLMAVARTPILLVGLPFGFPEGVSLSSFVSTMYTWVVLNQLLFMLGGVLWAATAVAFARRNRNACGSCGRTDEPAAGWTTPAGAARWGRWAAWTAFAVPLFYALTRWSWALAIPLGVNRAFLEEEARETPQIWIAGAALATLAVGGGVLTLGLIQRWGEVYPRWIPFLRGKPVRPRTAIVPATVVAVLLPGAGLLEIRAGIEMIEAGGFQDTWGPILPGFFWPLWAVALGAATLAYYFRRRGRCAVCGRLDPDPRAAAAG